MQYNQYGPGGGTFDEEISRLSRLNASFSQYGCLPCPGRSLPKWPPTGKYVYPEMAKVRGACESTKMSNGHEVALGEHESDDMSNTGTPPAVCINSQQ